MIVHVLLLVLLASVAEATTYYVRTDGNNANAGTTNSAGGAWATIGYAAANATVAGDLVLIQDGTYTEGEIDLNSAGTSGSRIVFRAQNALRAILASTARGDLGQQAIVFNANYVTVDGLKIIKDSGTTGSPPAGAYYTVRCLGSNVPTAASPSTGIVGCTFTNGFIDYIAHFYGGWKSNQDNSELSFSTVYSAEIFNNSDSIIRGNTIYSTVPGGRQGSCLYTKGGAHRTIVDRNICHITADGDIGLYAGGDSSTSYLYDSGTGYESYDVAIRNNFVYLDPGVPIPQNYMLGARSSSAPVFYNNSAYGSAYVQDNRFESPSPNTDASTWKNNTMDCRGQKAHRDDPSVSSGGWTYNTAPTIDYNNYYNCTINIPTQTHGFTSNPLFVSTTDLHLQSGSPMRDVGLTIGSFSNDIDGETRPQGSAWDIGADELPSGRLRMLMGVGQ